MKWLWQRKDEELNAEIRHHLDEAIRDRIARGEAPNDARANALREFGNIGLVKEVTREMWGWAWFEALGQDVRFGLRMLRKNPGFSLIAILTLTLGIGANTAIFSVVNAVFIRPLPYPHAEEVVAVDFPVPPALFLSLKKENTVCSDLAAFANGISTWPVNLTGVGEPERLQGFRVSANFFRMLGVAAAQGRTFLDEEDRFGNHRVVVISHQLWQRSFGGDPALVGRSISLNGASWQVVGVMPADFRLIIKTDVWSPLALTAEEESGAAPLFLHVFGRLSPGVARAQARQEIEQLIRQHRKLTNEDVRLELPALQKLLFGFERPFLTLQFAAVAIILLIACANLANLLLARAAVRQREMAVRLALGAGRFSLMRQLLIESGLLAMLGGVGGLLLASRLIPVLVGGLPPHITAKNYNVAALQLDGYALGFTLALAVLTTILFGLLPALQTSQVTLNTALKEGGRSPAAGRGANRWRSLLVVSEIALALVLLISAGLILKGFWRLTSAPPGFDSTGVLTARLDPTGEKYREPQQFVAFYQQLLPRLAAVPGVAHVGLKNNWDQGWRLAVEGRPLMPEEQRPWVSMNQVSADYFRALRINLQAGRYFTDHDVGGAPPVAIIDDTFARRHFPNENPLGQRLRFDDGLREIVGVVAATRVWHSFSFDEGDPRVYLPYQQASWRSMYLIARAQAGDPASLIPAIRRELAAVDKDQPIGDFTRLSESVPALDAAKRFSAALLTSFALLAALLAVIGIYGVTSYSVAQRTHEVGIRLALGAQAGDVLRLVIRQGLKLIAAGVTTGWLVAWVVTRLIAHLLYGVSANDLPTFAGVTLLLALIGVLACWIPARRATKVDPLIALRHE